jgi:hypothetical protein
VAGIPLVDLSEPLSRGIGDDPRLIGAPACIMAERRQLAADVMGAGARLHADQAARNVGETAFELTTGHLLPQNDDTPLVEPNEVEGLLADVDPDRGMIPAIF